jgi:hypothetical protein
MIKVQNMTSDKGNDIPNQFIIKDNGNVYFQSYNSIIALIPANRYGENYTKPILLDEYYWDFSRTTGKYRNIFLGETKKETEAKIKSGEYLLTNLN